MIEIFHFKAVYSGSDKSLRQSQVFSVSGQTKRKEK